jgi:hypothetical protein
MKYGAYENENEAALARDYAAKRLAQVTRSRQWPINSERFSLQSKVEKAKIDARVSEWVLPRSFGCERPRHGVEIVAPSEASEFVQYRVRRWVGQRRVLFGTFLGAELAGLVSDYVSQEFLSKPALNYPRVQLSGQDE